MAELTAKMTLQTIHNNVLALNLFLCPWQHRHYRSAISVERPIKLATVDLVEGRYNCCSRMGCNDSVRHYM